MSPQFGLGAEVVVAPDDKDDTELFRQFSDNPAFKKWLTDTIFAVTYARGDRALDDGSGRSAVWRAYPDDEAINQTRQEKR